MRNDRKMDHSGHERWAHTSYPTVPFVLIAINHALFSKFGQYTLYFTVALAMLQKRKT